ncbi:hypothetical protein HDU87_005662 [Geranomyces variabilis]|uniref:Uncharacterized protein n=1 Tax=Geranomyces variabilis TaxID=109894 RepID=A0AAD5TGB7_9FUNG|nr:hypothetical protein HDU87_005662 [Geranomyces variabilis]
MGLSSNPKRGDAGQGSLPLIHDTGQRAQSPQKQPSGSIDRVSQPDGAVLGEIFDAGSQPALPDQDNPPERYPGDQRPVDRRTDPPGETHARWANDAFRYADPEVFRQRDPGQSINSRVHHGQPMAPEHPAVSGDLNEQRLIAPHRDHASEIHDDATSRIRAAADARKHIMNNRLSRSYDRQPIELVRRSSEPGRPSGSRGLVFYHADRALRNTSVGEPTTPPPSAERYTRPQDVALDRLVRTSDGDGDDEGTLSQHNTSESD